MGGGIGMGQQQTPKIHDWLGFFADNNIERKYRDSTLPQQRNRGMAVAVAITTISFFHLAYEFPRLFHHLNQFEFVLFLRLIEFVTSFPYLIFQYRTQSQTRTEFVQTLYGLVLVSVSFAMMAYNPSDGALAAAGIVAMTSGIYFFAPLSVSRVVLLGGGNVGLWLDCLRDHPRSAGGRCIPPCNLACCHQWHRMVWNTHSEQDHAAVVLGKAVVADCL